MTDLKKLAQEIYNDDHLPEERLSAILKDTEAIRYYRSKQMFWYSAAAAVVVFCFYTVMGMYKNNTLEEMVLNEIAANHLQQLELEVKANNYDELAQKMKNISFPIKPPDEPLDHFYRVRGARYSTIHGNLAAQVQLSNKMRPQNHTMYATSLTDELNAIEPAFYQRDGVNIKVWKNNNMFYSIARTVRR